MAASVSAVQPAAAFSGRATTVNLSGFATEWSETVSVSFGEGVTVEEVTVASPTAIVATIRPAVDARVGPRDVTVTQGGQVLTYAQGFRVESPLEVSVAGTAAQGSVIDVTVRSLDFELAFDDGAPESFVLDLGPGVRTIEGRVEVMPFQATATCLVDVSAAAGPHDVIVRTGPAGAVEERHGPGLLEIAARSPTPLELGVATTGMEDEPRGTQLYAIAPSSGHVVDLRASAVHPDAEPNLAVLPSSGSFLDVLAFARRDFWEAPSGGTFYLIYWDGSGTSGYSYTLRATQTMPVTLVDETVPEPDNDSQASALATGPLPVRIAAVLEAQSDQDWFAVGIDPADGGRLLTVGSYGGDYFTDTVIEVYAPDGTTRLGLSPDDVFLDWLEVATSAGGGTHYVRIRHSTFGFDPTQTEYRAIVKLE